MTPESLQFSSNYEPKVAIEIIPVEEENNQKVTWAYVEQMYIDIEKEVSQLKGYSAKSLSTGNRGAEILLIGTIATAIAANKDLFINLSNTVFKVIELLIKRERVQEIEIRIQDRVLVLKDVRKKDVVDLIDSVKAFIDTDTQQLGMGTTTEQAPTVNVCAKISQ